MNRLLFIGWILLSNLAGFASDETRIKRDEEIVFYPTFAQRIPCEAAWRVEIRGCIFEPEKRWLMMAALREALDLGNVATTASEEKALNERTRLFLVDHERSRKIYVRVGSKSYKSGKSKADGTFSVEVRLTDAEAGNSEGIAFETVLPSSEKRSFRGEVLKLDETGLSVISDIDDTIKITEVRERYAMLRNTFLQDFRPVAGMADFYQLLARSNHAQFHYISASPWQLYQPLAAFVEAHGFPRGVFALKEFRWKNRTFLSLFTNPEKYKPTVIEPLLKRFPKRRFILIGDSGERDPEIYASLARKYPKQIAAIYIRDATGESAGAERYVKTFRGLPTELWQVFSAPAELKPFIDALPNFR